MLNLTLVQKHLSSFRNVHHKGSKNCYLQGQLNPFSRIFGFSVTPHLHVITSPDTQALATKISLRRGQPSGRVSQLEGCVSNSQTPGDSPWCSLGKIFSLNCPDKKYISIVVKPLISVAKIIKKRFLAHFMLFVNVQWGVFNNCHGAAQSLGGPINIELWRLK